MHWCGFESARLRAQRSVEGEHATLALALGASAVGDRRQTDASVGVSCLARPRRSSGAVAANIARIVVHSPTTSKCTGSRLVSVGSRRATFGRRTSDRGPIARRASRASPRRGARRRRERVGDAPGLSPRPSSVGANSRPSAPLPPPPLPLFLATSFSAVDGLRPSGPTATCPSDQSSSSSRA